MSQAIAPGVRTHDQRSRILRHTGAPRAEPYDRPVSQLPNLERVTINRPVARPCRRFGAVSQQSHAHSPLSPRNLGKATLTNCLPSSNTHNICSIPQGWNIRLTILPIT